MNCCRIVLAEKARTPVSVACELLGVSTHDAISVHDQPGLIALPDAELFDRMAAEHRAIVTENASTTCRSPGRSPSRADRTSGSS